MGSGILTVALPRMAVDLSLNKDILLWPAAVYALSAGCTLLIFGSVADIIGDKRVWLTGSILYTFFTLACGLAKTGNQLIAFRTLLGVSIAMCLPSAVSLMTRIFPPGKRRNIGFASMGMGQPLGYSVGLILGGVFVDSIGWRYGYYISAIINALLSCLAFWGLPQEKPNIEPLRKGITRIDWVGAPLISVSLALLSFVLAEITESYHSLRKTYIIVLLVISIALIPTFVAWVEWQERRGRPALIPNSLWKNTMFSATCIIVFFTWAVFNALQYFSSLYFQQIQHHSALISSLMFLPMVGVGVITNIFTGYMVDKVRVGVLVFGSASVSTISPLLMALVNPSWGYWRGPFVAMLLSPLHPDVLFTVSNLIISHAYPGQNQALAGAVFNSVSQVGNSVGLAVSAAIAASVQDHSHDDILKGYQAAYWLMFAAMIVVCVVSYFGLRGGGYIGKKSD
ncbi:major facilitator superfamily domain-containing protein [Aspergillus avenaceus]|uniref:Major facilitator superfamily domain-containing protein n=1 Tax=Aspergillus avenaceus TaxID=36643 RepID=A0A5N6TWV6_ASPAV|nr:major facilitator superfamily domain-containing protein [Aspergillus avenaceus]